MHPPTIPMGHIRHSTLSGGNGELAPRALMATLPTCVPCGLPLGTTALTISPVLKPKAWLAALAFVRGKPCSFIKHIWRRCHRCALIASGTISRQPCIRSGVLAPTQRASSQWVLGSPRWTRFHLVRPPLAVSTGSANASSRWCRARRVLLTAAASFEGALACAWTSGCPNSCAVRLPLAWLQS